MIVEHGRRAASVWRGGTWASGEVHAPSRDWDPQGVIDAFDELDNEETPLQRAAQYHVDRWAEYEGERRERMEHDESYARERHEQLSRANETRKRKRRGDHLTNADRVRLADDIRKGRDPREIAAELKLGVNTAERINQLRLWDDEEAA